MSSYKNLFTNQNVAIKTNSGSGDCYYLSIIDAIKNKGLTMRILECMGNKYKNKGFLEAY